MEQVRSELNNSNDLDQNGVYGRDRMWGSPWRVSRKCAHGRSKTRQKAQNSLTVLRRGRTLGVESVCGAGWPLTSYALLSPCRGARLPPRQDGRQRPSRNKEGLYGP